MWRIERQRVPPAGAAPRAALLAALLTVAAIALVFAALGRDPWQGLQLILLEPWNGRYAIGELVLKATPLTLCGLGVALCFRAGVWNIGVEGQLIAGAIAAGGTALLAGPDTPRAFVLLVLAAGMAGGMAWAAVTAWLRDRFHASEILVGLMLAYVAQLLLGYLVFGPWKDPMGFNFPQSRSFEAAALLPRLVEGARAHAGALLALAALPAGWLLMASSHLGHRMRVVGAAPLAARFAGYADRETLWVAMLACGALAGLAGAGEVAGPMERLTPAVSSGYGFAAIIVAVMARLHPLAVAPAALLMAMLYVGGELAQSRMGLPSAATGLFQGLALVFLLLGEALAVYRVRLVRRAAEPS